MTNWNTVKRTKGNAKFLENVAEISTCLLRNPSFTLYFDDSVVARQTAIDVALAFNRIEARMLRCMSKDELANYDWIVAVDHYTQRVIMRQEFAPNKLAEFARIAVHVGLE